MLKEKIIALVERTDDQEVLLFILIILEDALQWEMVSNAPS